MAHIPALIRRFRDEEPVATRVALQGEGEGGVEPEGEHWGCCIGVPVFQIVVVVVVVVVVGRGVGCFGG